MAQSGIFVVNLSIDKHTNRLLDEPEIMTHGFVSDDEDAKIIITAVQKRVVAVVNSGVRVERDIAAVVRTYLFNTTKRRPVVSVNITRT